MKTKKIFSWLIAATVIFSNITINKNFTQSAYAATTEGDFTLSNDTLTIKKDSDLIDLQVCTSNILRVNYKPGGIEDENTEVIDPNQKWGNGKIVKSDLKSDPAILQTDDMIVKISKSDLSVSVYDASNGLLVKQDKISDAKNVSFTHNSGENFYGVSGYGCGTNANDGSLRNNNSYDVTCAGQGWAGGPFVWSTGGYGVLVDSDGGKVTTGDTSLSYNGISKKDAEYFVIVGNPETIAKGVSEISGKTPMYPKWAMGFTNTQWGWPGTGTIEDQVKSVIGTYRSKNIPIDNFCFDFDWKYWGAPERDNGEFTWNGDNFPNAESGKLKTWTEQNGIHFTGIVKPRIFTGKEAGRDTLQYATAKANGWTFGGGSDYCASKDFVSINFSTQKARDWWWSCYQNAFDKGLSGFWNDEIDHENGYGNFGDFDAERALYEGQRKYTDDSTRVWSINRNFYLGAQRYGYGTWTGDISTGFDNMKGQAGKLIAAVNLGQNKWGMDTGGFNGGDPSPENYARWIEFSAFTPIFRVHGQDCRTKEQAPNTGRGVTPRYPWAFGSTAEDAAKNAIQLRYKLIPYIYKYEHDASEGGSGIVKSLMMQYPNDENVKGEVYSWMFGDYMLVSPVLDSDQTEKEIYLPKGKWIDYSTGKEYDGGQKIKVSVDSTKWKDIPIFVKQGAIIPSQQSVNYVGEKKIDNINLDVFPSAKQSSFEYYDDDGESYDYEDKGNVFKQNLTVSPNATQDGVTFKTAEKEGSYTGDLKTYTVKLHVKNAKSVTLNGKELTSGGTLLGADTMAVNTYAKGTDSYGDAVYVKVPSGEVNTIEVKCDVPEATEQSATVYTKTQAGSADFEYSPDNGSTWVNGGTMMQSTNAGYLEANLKYKLSTAENVKFRYKVDGKYYPSQDGVELSNEKDKFTITKDGKVRSGAPSISSANIYIGADSVRPVIQYKDDIGWSDVIPLSKYGAKDGQYEKTIGYDSELSGITVRYSVDNGNTWLPSDEGTNVTTGDFTGEDANITSGRPNWDNIVTLYYKGNATNVHWRPLGGAETSWTKSPGDKLVDSEFAGYKKAELNVGTAAGAECCFNINGGNWDSNGSKNYKTPIGACTFESGNIKAGDPEGNGASSSSADSGCISIISSIRGATYAKAQSLTLKSADNSASIYYTTDGSIPTEKSTKYDGPISISKDTTVKSIAVSTASKSAINTQKYVINPDGGEVTYDALSSASVNASASSVTEGTDITLTASCNTDDPSVQYSFGYYDQNNEYNELSGYSSKSTYKWAGAKKEIYDVVVKAKSDNARDIQSSPYKVTVKSKDTANQTTYDELKNAYINISSKTVIAGSKVQLAASCNTEDPDIQYSFGYYDENQKYHELSDYSDSNTYSWQVDNAGTYEVLVKAKSKTVSDIKSDTEKISIEAKPISDKGNKDKLSSVSLKSDKDSIKLGEKVQLIATVDYDDGNTKYQFGYYDEDNNFKSISLTSSSNKYIWTPEKVGTYDIVVRAIPDGDSNKKVQSKEYKITVKSDGNSNGGSSDSFDSNKILIICIMLIASGATIATKRRKERI